MKKSLKLNDKEKDLLSFFCALVLHDYKEHALNILTDDEPEKITIRTWDRMKMLMSLRDNYIEMNEGLIEEMISENFSRENAKKFLKEHMQDLPEGKVNGSICLD